VSERSKPWGALVISGAASALCYGLLFGNQKEVMAAFTRTDGWYPLLPVVTAFVFSFAHGAFTGCFWEVLGVTARRPAKEVERQELEE
jgi:hypothetical protein